MASFSEELRAKHPSLDFDLIESDITRGVAALIPVSRAMDVSPIAKMPWKVRNLFHSALRRNLELAHAFVDCFNQRQLIPVFVLARSVLETGCLSWDAWERLDAILDSNDKTALRKYDAHLMNVLMGTKTDEAGGHPEVHEAPNVLTVIDRLDRGGIEHLRAHYDFLSEYAHPNFWGMHEPFTEPQENPPEISFVDCPFEHRENSLLFPMTGTAVGLSMAVDAVENCEQHLPEFIRLCEEDLHDEGTWPPGVPFPRI